MHEKRDKLKGADGLIPFPVCHNHVRSTASQIHAIRRRGYRGTHFRSGTGPGLRGLVVGWRAYGVNEPSSCSFMAAMASSSPRASVKVTKPNPRGA